MGIRQHGCYQPYRCFRNHRRSRQHAQQLQRLDARRLPPCDMGVDLQFKYDYNVQRADMFNDHVGGVCVFVFDEQGNLVARQDAANEGKSQPLKDPNYAMRIDLQPGKYRFATFAFQKKYEEALSQAGAKFHIEAPAAGESIENSVPDSTEMPER